MDLDHYLNRIGIGRPSATVEGAARLQLAHRMAIGFENLDVMLGRGIRVDAASVFEKLVVNGRGGYCFEQNRLYSNALTTLGIPNRPLLARVRLGQPADAAPPRTHVCLLAEIEGGNWLVDAGFGGSYVPVMPLADGAVDQTDDGASHRVRHIGDAGSVSGQWMLERKGPASATDGRALAGDGWQAQYTFDLGEVAPIDLEQASHWTSTRAGTRFTVYHVASIPLADGFASMLDRELTVHRAGEVKRQTLDDPAAYAAVLRDLFRISLSDEEAARLPLFAED